MKLCSLIVANFKAGIISRKMAKLYLLKVNKSLSPYMADKMLGVA